MPWDQGHPPNPCGLKGRENPGPTRYGMETSRDLAGRLELVIPPPRASASGLSPGLESPGPLGRTGGCRAGQAGPSRRTGENWGSGESAWTAWTAIWAPGESSPPAGTPSAVLCWPSGEHYSGAGALPARVWHIRPGICAIGLAACEHRPEVQVRYAGSRVHYAGVFAH